MAKLSFTHLGWVNSGAQPFFPSLELDHARNYWRHPQNKA